jgi:hypothetical protein
MHEVQHVIFVFMPGVAVPLDFTNSLLSTVGIHASIQFIVVDGLTLVLSYECIIFNTWTLQMVKVVSEAFLVLGPFLVLSPWLCVAFNPYVLPFEIGMNGVDLL